MREHTECVYCGRTIERLNIETFKRGEHGEPECDDAACSEFREAGVISDDDIYVEGGEV
ncbi:hypothetical protein JSY36_16850 [Bacillus sp. H-16]|uniref:hypothetical protein n=1 Tax=Alteribacter salitolerans TaxID=2912333 RepID=UPI0019644589|nr:hypothetical protein [Alteribacter salitolerans]MBM7097404.1 hypothetical protein [Alteribacter salitolerans]